MIRFRLMVSAFIRVIFCLACMTFVVIIIFEKYVTHERNIYKFKDVVGAVNLTLRNLEDYDLSQLSLRELLENNYTRNYMLPQSYTCDVQHPRFRDIMFNNDYWQVFKTSLDGNIYLFAAYYDNRPLMAVYGPLVRITVMIDRILPPSAYCQLWETGADKPAVVKAFFKLLWPKNWGNFKDGYLIPYLVTCKIPSEMSNVPITVSLVENPCDKAVNNLQVINERRSDKLSHPSFAVCVKALSYYDTDISVRLVEWLELLRILGASKVIIYELAIHPNITKVLKYYQDLNFVQVIKTSFPGSQPNHPQMMKTYQEENIVIKRQHELIPYNDCFYRQLNVHDYVSILDIDEIILPVKKDLFSWMQILQSTPSIASDAICARHVYFFDEWELSESQLPRYFYMLNHVLRSANHTTPTEFVKCFHSTQRVIAVHNHFPMTCASSRRVCIAHVLDPKISQLQHYRKGCTLHLSNECKYFKSQPIFDFGIRRYYEQLKHRVHTTLQQLDFL